MITLPSHSSETYQGLEDILSAVIDIIDDDILPFQEHDNFLKPTAASRRKDFGAARQ